MRSFWQARSPRERVLLAVAAALFAAGAIYTLVAAPLGRWRAGAERKAVRAEAVYDLVAEAAAKGADAAARVKSEGSPQPLRSTLVVSARESGVTLNFVNTRADGGVEASVDAVAPAILFAWLQNLESQHAIHVTGADIARESDDAALVRAQLVFGAGE